MIGFVNKIKKLAKKTKQDFWVKTQKDSFNEELAKKIQKIEHKKSKTVSTKNCSPTYLSISNNLNESNEQVFKAGVYNLTKIAINNQQYRKDILQILEEQLKNNKYSQRLMGYLAIKISIIKNLEEPSE